MRVFIGGAQYSMGDSKLNRAFLAWVLIKTDREVRHGGFICPKSDISAREGVV